MTLQFPYHEWSASMGTVHMMRTDRRMMGDPMPPVEKALSITALTYAKCFDS